MSRLAQCALVACALGLGVAGGLTAAVTTVAAADGETPDPYCVLTRYVETCVHKDGNTTVEYLDSSAQSASPAASGLRPAPPPPVCRTVTLTTTAVCQCDILNGDPLYYLGSCDINPNTTSQPDPPSITDVVTTVTRAIATLRLPDGAPVIAPDPQANEWKMLVVGYPMWLTTTAPATTSTTVTQNGITIHMSATRTRTVFDMGEKNVPKPTLTCTKMTPRPAYTWPHDAPSPDCGYTYMHKGVYTITATTTWRVDWSAAPQNHRCSP